jgi:hypothetical protein
MWAHLLVLHYHHHQSTGTGNRKEDGGNDPPIVNRLQWEGTPYNMSSVILAPFVR